jgi:CBS domain containing-hemolysin-like protein
LVTILILNVLVNILVQNVASSLFGEFSGWGLRVGVPLALTLIFGEVIPKSIALQNNDRIAQFVAPVIGRAKRILGPLRRSMTRLTGAVSKWMFFFLKRAPEMSRDEMELVLSTSQEQGVVDKDEAEMMDGLLDLRDTSVRELMQPREDIIFFKQHDPLLRLTHLFVDQECSRIPVCDGEINNILGVISARSFFLEKDSLKTGEDLAPLLQKPFFVPETTLASHLIRQLDEKQELLAIAVDEYGSVSGLVSREDVVELVVGDIEDRRDQKTYYSEAGDGVIIASGKLELSDFEELFDVDLQSPNHMVTVGGWLTEQLGDIPKAGTNYVTRDFLFHVLSADPNRVRRIYIRKLKPKQGGKA